MSTLQNSVKQHIQFITWETSLVATPLYIYCLVYIVLKFQPLVVKLEMYGRYEYVLVGILTISL